MTAFYLKPSTDSIKHYTTIYLSERGTEASPAYTLRHPDPALPASKNRYAAALYDSYNAEILFGEVLLIPEWTQPTLSQDEIKQNGGVPPPPQPILPAEFTIQLYNPDQQVLVKQHSGSWNSASFWEFEMPQKTFRLPSTSALDRTQSDPTASDTTPKINFKWKRDGKLSKDLVCNLSGKSTNPDGSKRKNKEPDIAVAFFHHQREVTVYEPNLYRVEMEDPKGLEVVLLLSAAVIRDVYFGQLRETFNIADMPRRGSVEAAPGKPCPIFGALPQSKTPASQQLPPRHHQQASQYPHVLSQYTNRPPLKIQTSNSRPPPTDPRSQWEIDTETARLKKQVEHEERERKRAEHAETKRLKQMLEAEEKEARRKRAEVDKETERLRREYAADQRQHEQRTPKPSLPPRHNLPQRNSTPLVQQPFPNFHPQQQQQYFQPVRPTGPYLQPPGISGNPSSSGFFNGPSLRPDDGRRVRGKSSFFGLRSRGDDHGRQLKKKQSSIF